LPEAKARGLSFLKKTGKHRKRCTFASKVAIRKKFVGVAKANCEEKQKTAHTRNYLV